MTNSLTQPISSQTYADSNVTFSASVENLHAEPMLNLFYTNEGKKETCVLPLNILPELVRRGNNVISELHRAQITAQRDLYNPSLRFDSLVVMSEKPSFRNSYILNGEDGLVEGTPYLYWFEPSKEEKGLEPGWKVSLVGAEDKKVLFAKWDDMEGIDSLVNSLSNKESLFITLALIDPNSTAKLAARKTISELKGTRGSLPAVKMTSIRKMIKELNLDTITEGTYSNFGFLTSLFVVVDKIQIPVAIRVDPSNKPVWKEVLPETNDIEYRALSVNEKAAYDKNRRVELDLIKQKTHTEWIRRFKLGLSEMPGWRVVDIPNREYSYARNPEAPGLWVTRIPGDTWEDIKPAVFAAAKKTNTRGSKF